MNESTEACRAMTAAQAGDSAAYERLLRGLVPELRAFVQRQLPDCPEADAVLHDVLLAIHRLRHTYRPERPFGPWLRTIADNAVADAQGAHASRRRRRVSLDAVNEPPEPRRRRVIARLLGASGVRSCGEAG